MKPPTPNLLIVHNYHILEYRAKKLLRLEINQEKSLARKQSQEEEGPDQENSEEKMILDEIDNSDFTGDESEKEDEEEDDDEQSFDSQPHNAYQQYNQVFRDNIRKEDQIHFDSIESVLIIEFDAQFSNPIINVLPPIVPPPLQQKNTQSIGIQTIPIEAIPVEKKAQKEKEVKEKEKEKQKQKQKPKIVPQALVKREVSPTVLSDGLGIKSQIKGENFILTQSIQMPRDLKEEKKKPSTFMQYYNSIPVKKPTNLLEKYIKRKK